MSTENVSCQGDENVTHTISLQPFHMVIVYSIGYGAVIVIGLLGNALVIHIVLRNVSMHTVTNCFIVNLAIADILVCLFVLPITLLTTLFFGWSYGEFLCKTVPFVQGVSVNASINSLAAIAFDRYLAICHPLRFKLHYRQARVIVTLIWLEAVSVMIPWPLHYNVVKIDIEGHCFMSCKQNWPFPSQERDYFLGAIFVTCYCVPLTLISVFYALITWRVWFRHSPGVLNSPDGVLQRSKVKVVRMLLILTAIFAASWLPLYALMLVCYYSRCPDISVTLQPIFQWLGSSTSCVNPIIYCFASNKWRDEFRKLMPCVDKRRQVAIDQSRYASVTATERRHQQNNGSSLTSHKKRLRYENSKQPVTMSEV